MLNIYGFDGLDIDIESGNCILVSGGTIANPGSQGQIYFIDAIKEIMNAYRLAHGGNKMMLTAAPETAYVQGGMSGFASIWGGYLPVINALRDSLDILQVQLYNSGTMYGIDGGVYTVGTVDFVVALTEAVIQGFNTQGGYFTGLPASKIAVGMPACNSAAGSGYMSPDSLLAAMRYLIGEGTQPGSYALAHPEGYPSLRGMMTWSINWDAAPACNGAYTYASVYESVFGNATWLNDQNDILTFTIPNQSNSTINNTTKTVIVTMPVGTDITLLTPSITVSQGASVTPNSGVTQNFTTPVTYSVTAENGTVQVWTVTVTIPNTIADRNLERLFLYHNPTNGLFYIQNIDNQKIKKIIFFDYQGKTIQTITNVHAQPFIIEQRKGLFFVQIITENQIYTQKLVIE
jgi:hypothetical protein